MKKIFPVFFLGYVLVCFYTLAKYDMFGSVIGRMAMCWLAALGVMTLLYFWGRRIRRIDVVDVGWGLSILTIALCGFFLQDGVRVRWDPQTLTTLLVVVWGSRLAWHIGRRIMRTNHEDERYVELRKKWRGNIALNTFFRVYFLQSILALVVSIPVVHINLAQDTRWSFWVFAGCAMWLAGFVIESVADRQLARFVANPINKGKLMTEGLWKHARHPNYFGELAMWWGIAVISLGTPHGWVGLGGAAFITYLIVYVSGIPLKEAHLRKREGWQEYTRNSNTLWPLPSGRLLQMRQVR